MKSKDLKNILTTSQQFQDVGFDKGQADALADGFARTDQHHDDIMMLLQSVLSEVKEVKQGLAVTNNKVDAVERKVDATNRKLVDFQLETIQKFSDTHWKISDLQWKTGWKISDLQWKTEWKFTETYRKISDAHLSLIMWIVGTVVVTVSVISVIGAGVLWISRPFWVS